MLYLTQTDIASHVVSLNTISYDSIFATPEDKLRYICLKNRNERFLKLLNRIYSLPTDIPRGYFSTTYNPLISGLCLEYAIAIIENPHIVCTGGVTVDGICLPERFAELTEVIHLGYNGNYANLIYKKNNIINIQRILLSTTDTSFLPSSPEYIFDCRSRARYQFVYNHNYDQIYFIEDDQISDFVNHRLERSCKLVYVFVNSDKYAEEINFITRHYNVILLVRVKKIFNYYFLNESHPKLIIFINSDDSTPFNCARLRMFADKHNIYVDSTLNPPSYFRHLSFREFGMIRTKDELKMLDKTITDLNSDTDNNLFRYLRKLNNLTTISSENNDPTPYEII